MIPVRCPYCHSLVDDLDPSMLKRNRVDYNCPDCGKHFQILCTHPYQGSGDWALISYADYYIFARNNPDDPNWLVQVDVVEPNGVVKTAGYDFDGRFQMYDVWYQTLPTKVKHAASQVLDEAYYLKTHGVRDLANDFGTTRVFAEVVF